MILGASGPTIGEMQPNTSYVVLYCTNGTTTTYCLLPTVANQYLTFDVNGTPQCSPMPAVGVNSDWSAVSGTAQILNKPTLSAVATSGSYSDILNKPALGTAAAQNSTAFATSAQGSLAATAVQPTGTTLQYIRGDGSLAAFPTLTSGTVTSVGLSMPTGFTVSGSPVTGSGSLAVTTSLSGIVQSSGGAFSAIIIGSGLSLSASTLSCTVSQLALSSTTPSNLGATAAIGAGTTAARSDHVHQLPSGINTVLGTATISENSITTLTVGLRRVLVSVSGAVVGGNYFPTPTSLPSSGFSVVDAICTSSGQISFGVLCPILTVGSYSIAVRIIQIGT